MKFRVAGSKDSLPKVSCGFPSNPNSFGSMLLMMRESFFRGPWDKGNHQPTGACGCF
jgi:hypothetical protein